MSDVFSFVRPAENVSDFIVFSVVIVAISELNAAHEPRKLNICLNISNKQVEMIWHNAIRFNGNFVLLFESCDRFDHFGIVIFA